MSIDKEINKELEEVKKKRAEIREQNKESKYSSFAMKCLYTKTVKTLNKNQKNIELKMIDYIVRTDIVYQMIMVILYNSEYILNRSYMSKFISKKCACSLTTVYDKINELEQLCLVEVVDTSVRLTKLAIKTVFKNDVKDIRYKKDSKERSKLRINMYAKGYRKRVQEEMERKLNVNLRKEKIFILKDNSVLLTEKEMTGTRQGYIADIISKIDRQKIDEKGERIKAIYVISRALENKSIHVINTKMLEDAIDFKEYNKKKK